MRILLLGDVHSDYEYMGRVYSYATKVKADIIIQLGDWGMGFKGFKQFSREGIVECVFTHYVSEMALSSDIPCYFIGGNHENYDWLEELLLFVPNNEDGTYEVAPMVKFIPRGTRLEFDCVRFLCCGGGTSINRGSLTDYVSWWPQEEITYADVDKCAQAGAAHVLLTHDFPWESNCMDRHLDPYWGEWAQTKVIESRKKVSDILLASHAQYHFHGHLHLDHLEIISLNSQQQVVLKGLAHNGEPIAKSTFLLETTSIEDGTAAAILKYVQKAKV